MDAGVILVIISVAFAVVSVIFAVLARRQPKWILERAGEVHTFDSLDEFLAAMTPAEQDVYLGELLKRRSTPDELRRWIS